MKRLLLLGALALLAAPAAHATVISYDVTTTFYEPDTQPYNTVFVGSFTYDSASQTVSNLHGTLSESMTGNASRVSLDYQLSSIAGAGGLLVTAFRNASTNTLTTMFGGDGWTPGSDEGSGLYYGFPDSNPANAYVRIFVNTSDPTAPLTQAQLDALAYADCTDGGMMGAVCMTGTSVAGYGYVGTMSGTPASQVVTAVIPEPASGAMIATGMGLLGLSSRRRRGGR